MANHINAAFVVQEDKEDGMYIMGDPFWPQTTDKLMKATRSSTLKDAKAYVKTASKRLKEKTGLKIVPVQEERDDKFNLVNVSIDF